MAEKRKDKKGRILRAGESQRKDGRYSYKYRALDGKRKEVYAKTIQELREKEEQIRQDLRDGIDSEKAAVLTLNDVYDEMQSFKQLKRSTTANKERTYNKRVRASIGERKISSIKYYDIVNYYNSLLDEGLQLSTVRNIHGFLNGAFEYALKNDIIRKNPCRGALSEIRQKRTIDDKPKKKALTRQEQDNFLEFVKYNYLGNWHSLFVTFLGTGCRISELVGLRWEDVDFKKGIIDINHNTLYIRDENKKYGFYVDSTKTSTGKRQIPMIREVRMALLEIREKQFMERPTQLIIDDYTGFIFLNRNENLYNAASIDSFIKRAVAKYNATEKGQKEPLPHFSVHILRHTFITRLCEVEDNVKAIQAIAGHSDISTTMNVYAEATRERNEEAMKKLEGRIKLS